ncbi:MAG: hypothetical protein M0R33_18945 [Methylomonas sp.]|jgi:hypothetical protein|uniref:hypothetical protein n=1 Tax=Methylomonas sp. TaxID=418 RepID=UPI0026007258|nr:hypothetical protein [Methylomonas sp.]MCK9608523.1 hypothetical protein [Methylomonas sp.]
MDTHRVDDTRQSVQLAATQFTAYLTREESPISLISQDIVQTIFEQIKHVKKLNIVYIDAFDEPSTLIMICQIDGDNIHHEVVAILQEDDAYFRGMQFAWLDDKLYVFRYYPGTNQYISKHVIRFTKRYAGCWLREDFTSEMCVERDFPVLISDQHRLYAVGGVDRYYGPSDDYKYSVEYFDIETLGWQLLIKGAVAPQYYSAAYHNSEIAGIIGSKLFYFETDSDRAVSFDIETRCIENTKMQNRLDLKDSHGMPFVNIDGKFIGVHRIGDKLILMQFDAAVKSWRKLCIPHDDKHEPIASYKRAIPVEWNGQFCLVTGNCIFIIDTSSGECDAVEIQQEDTCQLYWNSTNPVFAFTT